MTGDRSERRLSQALRALPGEGFKPPEPRHFDLPGRSSTSARSVSPSRCCSSCWRRSWSSASSTWPPRSGPMVPGRLQYVGEAGYCFVRNTLGRDIIGSEDFIKLRAATVRAVLLHPVQQPLRDASRSSSSPPSRAPATSRALPALTWLVYNGVGIKKHGFLGYLKLQTVPSGVPGLMLAAARPAGVPVQHPRAAVHAGPATLRQHVRRTPAADPLRARRGVPAGPRRAAGRSRSACSTWLLLHRHRRSWRSWSSSFRRTSSRS